MIESLTVAASHNFSVLSSEPVTKYCESCDHDTSDIPYRDGGSGREEKREGEGRDGGRGRERSRSRDRGKRVRTDFLVN